MKAIASVTMAFLPLATIAVRDQSVPLDIDITDKDRRQSSAPNFSTLMPKVGISSSQMTSGSSGP